MYLKLEKIRNNWRIFSKYELVEQNNNNCYEHYFLIKIKNKNLMGKNQ